MVLGNIGSRTLGDEMLIPRAECFLLLDLHAQNGQNIRGVPCSTLYVQNRDHGLHSRCCGNLGASMSLNEPQGQPRMEPMIWRADPHLSCNLDDQYSNNALECVIISVRGTP